MKQLILVLFLLVSCKGKESPYVYQEEAIPIEVDERIYPLSTLQQSNKIDIVLVVDNSGSMGNIQRNVERNAELFFQEFAKDKYINWKLGIVSTDKSERPYLGFDQAFESENFDMTDPSDFRRAISTFQQAVERLGTSGSGYEYIFYNFRRHLDNYNSSSGVSFQRKNAHLVAIMISDEEEQSGSNGADYSGDNFYDVMSDYIPQDKVLRFYGALALRDLKDCRSTGDYSTYKNSPYEKVINASGGFNISACTSQFGRDLAAVGRDIATIVGIPSLLLKKRPVVDTLRVYYKDKLIQPGAQQKGGYWYYEERTNTINFYNVDFVDDLQKDHFRIEFDIDDGIGRPIETT